MQRKRLIRSSLLLVAFLATFFSAASAVAAEYFPRDLAEGDQGIDVVNLQVALNAIAETRVASSGAGSPGMETEFFGRRTAEAVSRYQTMKGIKPADGKVYGQTRISLQADLEKITGASNSPSPTSSKTEAPAAPRSAEAAASTSPEVQKFKKNLEAARAGAPIVFENLTVSAQAGERIGLVGYNFREGESYQIVIASTSKPFATAVATTSITLSFKVPRLRAGEYVLYVEGSNGRSADFNFFLGSRSRPEITRVTPDPIKVGDLVTITGSRFGRKDVSVSTSFGDLENLTVKNTKITFTSQLGADLPKIKSPAGGTTTIPVSLRVENPKGVSNSVIVYVAL
jgi:hypothetical protein